jgi:hypothetical protein
MAIIEGDQEVLARFGPDEQAALRKLLDGVAD